MVYVIVIIENVLTLVQHFLLQSEYFPQPAFEALKFKYHWQTVYLNCLDVTDVNSRNPEPPAAY